MNKRDNWTNDEVISILSGMIISEDIHPETLYQKSSHNAAIAEALDTFYSFKWDESFYGAMAFDTEQKIMVHVGGSVENAEIKSK